MSAIATVISARMASRRLPGKALRELGGVPMVQFLIDRLRTTKLGGELIFATTQRPDDDALANCVATCGIRVFRGADADVAGRYLALANEFRLDWIVRVTADCPFVNGESLDYCLRQWDGARRIDVMTTKGVFPIGIDYEVLSVATLRNEWPKMTDEEKEHLTLRFYRADIPFVVKRFRRPVTWPAGEGPYVVDTPGDYDRARRIVSNLGSRRFSVGRLLATLVE